MRQKDFQSFQAYIEHLDEQIIQALKIGQAFPTPPNFRKVEKILFCGIGGSAIGGDILRAIFSDRSKILISVQRGGDLPPWVDKNTLVIFESYSGKTEEVLHVLNQSLKLRMPKLLISSGGNLEHIARRKKIPFLKIPGGFPPRCAIGYLTFTLIPLLQKITKVQIPSQDMAEALYYIRHISFQQVERIARALYGKSIHLYAGAGLLEPAVVRWRTQIAENAKNMAAHHIMPEMFHNEIEAWAFPKALIKKSIAVFLVDSQDTSRMIKKRRLVQKWILESGAEVIEVKSAGKSSLARLFSQIALGDWVSYDLALLNRVDPLRTSRLEALKKI